jgi:hypothetical protein
MIRQLTLLPMCLLPVTVALARQPGNGGPDREPTVRPATVLLQFANPPALGATVILTMTIESQMDLQAADVRLYVPPEIHVIDGFPSD